MFNIKTLPKINQNKSTNSYSKKIPLKSSFPSIFPNLRSSQRRSHLIQSPKKVSITNLHLQILLTTQKTIQIFFTTFLSPPFLQSYRFLLISLTQSTTSQSIKISPTKPLTSLNHLS